MAPNSKTRYVALKIRAENNPLVHGGGGHGAGRKRAAPAPKPSRDDERSPAVAAATVKRSGSRRERETPAPEPEPVSHSAVAVPPKRYVALRIRAENDPLVYGVSRSAGASRKRRAKEAMPSAGTHGPNNTTKAVSLHRSMEELHSDVTEQQPPSREEKQQPQPHAAILSLHRSTEEPHTGDKATKKDKGKAPMMNSKLKIGRCLKGIVMHDNHSTKIEEKLWCDSNSNAAAGERVFLKRCR